MGGLCGVLQMLLSIGCIALTSTQYLYVVHHDTCFSLEGNIGAIGYLLFVDNHHDYTFMVSKNSANFRHNNA